MSGRRSVKFDAEDLGELQARRGRGKSGRGDVQRVRRGEQITALRILKWRGDASGINTSRGNLGISTQSDTNAMFTSFFFPAQKPSSQGHRRQIRVPIHAQQLWEYHETYINKQTQR